MAENDEMKALEAEYAELQRQLRNGGGEEPERSADPAGDADGDDSKAVPNPPDTGEVYETLSPVRDLVKVVSIAAMERRSEDEFASTIENYRALLLQMASNQIHAATVTLGLVASFERGRPVEKVAKHPALIEAEQRQAERNPMAQLLKEVGGVLGMRIDPPNKEND